MEWGKTVDGNGWFVNVFSTMRRLNGDRYHPFIQKTENNVCEPKSRRQPKMRVLLPANRYLRQHR
ncbi:hypothetical protein [Azospirillum endophyticum]